MLITGIAARAGGGVDSLDALYAASRDVPELHAVAPFRRFDPDMAHMAHTGGRDGGGPGGAWAAQPVQHLLAC